MSNIEPSATEMVQSSFEQRVSNASRLLELCIDFAKLTGMALLIVAGICAIVFPNSAKRVLFDMGLEVKEIKIFGTISLVQASTLKLADNLVEAQMSVDSALPLTANLSNTDKKQLESNLVRVKEQLNLAQSRIDKQDKAINDARIKSGLGIGPLPDSGWIFIGLLDSSGQYKNGSAPRIDSQRTVVKNGQPTTITLKYDAPVYETLGCEIVDVKDFQPPTADSSSALIRATPPLELAVLETKSCPMQSDWKQLYARIRIPSDRIRTVKYSDWK